MANLATFPSVRAVFFHRLMSSGATRPALFLCEQADSDGTTGDYVVKFRSARFGGTNGLCFEALAIQLAHHFSLPTPPAASVTIDTSIVASLEQERELHDRIIQNAGRSAFGSLLLTGGYSTMPLAAHVPDPLRDLAADIVAFDGLIANFDRTPANPNLLWNDEGLVLIDHELAFRCIDDPRWNDGTSWHDRLFYLRDHVLARGLRRQVRKLTFDRFHSALLQLTDERLQEMCANIPDDYGTERTAEICQHIQSARDDAGHFLVAVWGQLR